MERIKKWSVILVLIVILFLVYWNNMYKNGHLSGNSEELVTGTIYNKYVNERWGLLKPYGLGWYVSYNKSTADVLSDGSYEYGFCLNEKYIAVALNEVTQREYQVGYQLKFAKGQQCTITEVVYSEPYIYVGYDYPEQLTYENAGSIELLKVLDAEGNGLYGGTRTNYTSSFGLQGIVFAIVGMCIPITYAVRLSKFLCILLMVLVAMGICVLVNKKYNIYMAAVFYATFLLSPIVVAFAPNTYWLEGLLYVSVLIGLWISLDCYTKRRRIAAYLMSFFYILIKSMCGYEYITTVMLSLISFLLADGLAAIVTKMDKKKILVIFKTIFGIGVCALLGFAVALCIHGYLRGDGNVGIGLKDIYENDFLRRALGGNPENFDASVADSIKESIPSVLLKYFDFNNSLYETHIFLGISGAIFPFLCLGTCVMCLIGVRYRVMNPKECFLYFILFLSSISWFVLGKSHSAIHTFLNFLLWYFGYIQMVLYVIVKYILAVAKRLKSR